MKILVTGATGFVGQRLLERLLCDGHEIAILTRNPEGARKKIGLPLEAYEWQPSESPPPKEAFEKVNAVVHLAGESVAEGRWTASKKKRILDSRIKSTKSLVDAIRQHGSEVKSFVCASAIGFYGERGETLLDENSPRGKGFLADVCEQWEAAAQSIQNDVRTVSLRIGMVLGNGGALSKLLPIFRLGLGGPVGNGKQWVSWIHLEDLTALIAYSLNEETLSGPVNAVSPEPVTNQRFTQSLAKAMGVPAFLPAPKIALRIALGQMSELATNSQNIQPQRAIDSGFTFKYPDIDSAFKAIIPDPKRKCEERFTANQWIQKPVEEVFPFFSDAKNLEKITPPWLNFKVQGSLDSGIKQGQEIQYALKIHGIPVKWKSLIEEWKPNEFFVDSQQKGPYKSWHHTHKFYPIQEGTLIVDEIRYEVPGGSIGSLLLGPWIRSDIEKIFQHRQSVIETIYGK